MSPDRKAALKRKYEKYLKDPNEWLPPNDVVLDVFELLDALDRQEAAFYATRGPDRERL